MTVRKLNSADPQSQGKAKGEGSGTRANIGTAPMPEATTWAAMAPRESLEALTAAFQAACRKALVSATTTIVPAMPSGKGLPRPQASDL